MKKQILRKSNLFILFIAMLSGNLIAQPCTPGTFSDPWLHPDTSTNLSAAVSNLAYNQVLTVVVPQDTNISGFILVVDSFGITNVSGLPPGFTYQSNSLNNYWQGGSSGCLAISGIASYSQIGTYQIVFSGIFFGAGIQFPVDFPGYTLEIVDSVFANCFDTIDANAIDTCFSFTPYSAHIENYSFTGTDSVTVTWVISSQNNTQQAFVALTYPADSNGCHVMGLTIVCSKSTSYYFTDQLFFTDIVTGFEKSNVSGISIFPNPATDLITIAGTAQADVEIFNMRGALQRRFRIGDATQTVDISAFAPGVYFLRILSAEGITVKKFIKL